MRLLERPRSGLKACVPDKPVSVSPKKLLFAANGNDYRDPQLVIMQRVSDHGLLNPT